MGQSAEAANTGNDATGIEIIDVHKRFSQGSQVVAALKGITLQIPVSGEKHHGFFGIMGPSGSGKSTLLHLMAGMDKPDEGQVRVAGVDIGKCQERELTLYRRRKIGVVFQQFNLIHALTAEQNIALPAVVDGRKKKWIQERSRYLLDLLGLTERAHHRPEALSGGEQQRVAIARALLFSPSVILADEPTGNLDTQASEKVWALLSQIPKKENVLVVMITHEPAAASYCDHVHVLKDGRVTGQFDVGDLDASGVAHCYQQLEG